MTRPDLARRYPGAERLDLAETRHGITVADPYRWLEDPADPRTVAWLGAQDELLAAQRASWQTEQWRADLTVLDAVDLTSPPVSRRDRLFFTRLRAGEEHQTLLVRQGRHEWSLVSPASMDPSGRTVLDTWRPSIEGDLLAYQVSVDGTEDSCLRVIDVATGREVDGPIDRVRRTPIAWLPGGEHYYYVRRLPPELHPGEERYHRRVYLHRVGADPATDVMIFGDGRDRTQFYWVDVTTDGRWLIVSATTGTDPRTEIWLADLARGDWRAPVMRPIRQGSAARSELYVAPRSGPQDPVWLRTTDGASRGRIVTATPGTLDGPWREVIAERPDAVLTDLAVLTDRNLPRPIGLAAWSRHAVSEITVHDMVDGAPLGTVKLPGAGSVSNILTPRDGGLDAWFTYTDHQTPPTVLHYDARTGTTRPWHVEGTALGGGPHARQVEFASRDGTTVRMFVVSAAGRPDQPRPTILTGYGGFGVIMKPAYAPEILAWTRAGGVFAVACLRGGGEQGEAWHHAGRRENKRNVFDDFDAATDHLIDNGWTTRDQLGTIGGSNGGLLVGAALTQHPEKYALLDMARYERSGLGPSWRPEYGSADDPAEFGTLLSYSPYHRVERGTAYPPVLFTVADGDTRVDPMHARKMCAALQYASSGPGPVLFENVRGVGHGFWARSMEVAAKADCFAFLAAHLGLKLDGVGW
jgi:prolyl oligopeptidase